MDAAQFLDMKYRFDQGAKVAHLDFYVYDPTLNIILHSLRSTKMKRTALVLSLLFICGCNGSDSTTSSNNSGLSTPAQVSLVPAN